MSNPETYLVRSLWNAFLWRFGLCWFVGSSLLLTICMIVGVAELTTRGGELSTFIVLAGLFALPAVFGAIAAYLARVPDIAVEARTEGVRVVRGGKVYAVRGADVWVGGRFGWIDTTLELEGRAISLRVMPGRFHREVKQAFKAAAEEVQLAAANRFGPRVPRIGESK